jgi:cell division septation protein DedD
MYTFRLHRLGLIVAVVLALLLVAVIFFGGWVLGTRPPGGEGATAAAGAPAGTVSGVPAAPAVAAPAVPGVRAPTAPAGAAPAVPGAAGAAKGAAVGTAAVGAAAAGAGGGGAPASAAPGAAAPAAPGPGQPDQGLGVTEGFTLQVGAYLDHDEADALIKDLQERGYAAFLSKISASGGEILHRVCVGSYPTRAKAAAAGARFRQLEGRSAVVVQARLPARPAP